MAAVATREKSALQDIMQYHADPETYQSIQQTCDGGIIRDDNDPLGTMIRGLREVGVSEHAIHLIRLAPLIHVAWNDIAPSAEQREQLLLLAGSFGVRPGMVAYKLLECWLSARPDPCLFRTWSDYVGALRWAITGPSFELLTDESVRRAKLTAEIMRSGLAGLLPADSRQAAIQQIRAAF